ncbi:hypothetical protein SPOG_03638 [Schizosaccharomyces cryophilus OY26]|uniref:Uncharacterized protein n=1 Tax=Schizosaccharomyces cryophilus (strain OY26 / ATCC MYA-4695 / CBS 11777 / NBRC 106824 / NRRL Y48691) TaxID=653667 RepID=S9W3G4_SCHCR|nr:uncharacterized protein SPOG_03638 [Schizosaccharomyces cryophilus OY26]EPY53094.1 hypothetical protein SPOG_03638 [Schizosaccharomyces cryophilus OY26]
MRIFLISLFLMALLGISTAYPYNGDAKGNTTNVTTHQIFKTVTSVAPPVFKTSEA